METAINEGVAVTLLRYSVRNDDESGKLHRLGAAFCTYFYDVIKC